MGELVVEATIFVLKCFFWYPFAIPYWIGRSIYRRYQNRELPMPTRDQSRPPTPAETAQAQTQIKIAWALLQEATKYQDGWLGNIGKAVRALNIARQMDAGASIPIPGGDGTMTVDTVTAFALYAEAYKRAHDYTWQADWQDRMYQNKYQREALEAIDKAIRYDSRKAQFWAVKARAHKNLEQRAEALKAAMKAVELDHTDQDALALLGQLQ